MRKIVDLTGQKFGRLLIVAKAERLPSIPKTRWLCRCDCGAERTVYATNLLRGLTESCGCLAADNAAVRNSTHGYSRTREKRRSEYTTYGSMIGRCHNPNWVNYADYGGRGVTVCDRWRYGENGESGFECFIADMGDKSSPSLTIDRKDGSRPYEPDNCVWATRTQQARNRRSNRYVVYKGERMLLADALRLSGRSEFGFYSRVQRGWSESDALEIPASNQPRERNHVK